jgi:hypothetical protein
MEFLLKKAQETQQVWAEIIICLKRAGSFLFKQRRLQNNLEG